MSSPPVSSEVSPKKNVPPAAVKRSAKRPIVGLEPSPDVVSDSPHLVLITRSVSGISSRRIRVASVTI